MTAPISKTPDRIAGMFDAIAGRYDFLNHVLSAGIDRRWRRRAVRSLELTGRERVLDLCTGTGDLAIGARTAVPPASRVIGVDFAGEMLKVGLSKLHRLGLVPSISLVRADAEHLPIADQSVDAVTIGFGIRNVEHMPVAFDEIHRVLVPGGRFAILEFAVPTAPGVRGAYLWYFRNILPRLGRAISRHPGAYDYLPASVGAFETPDELVTILRRSGFVEIRAVPMTFGTVFLYTGQRHA